MRPGQLALSRKFSITAAVGTLILLVISGVLLIRSKEKIAVEFSPDSQELLQLPASSTISLVDFHRSESKNGRLVWEVKARRGEYYPESGRANLKEPIIILFDESNSTITLNAPFGVVLLANETLSEVMLTGGAKLVHQSGVTLESAELLYRAISKDVTTDKNVKITQPGFILTAQSLVFNIETQVMKLSTLVNTTITSADKTSQNSHSG